MTLPNKVNVLGTDYEIELVTKEMQQDLDKIRETCELSLECKQHAFDRKLEELEAQIEKMKRCDNCDYCGDTEEGFVSQECKDCDGKCNWKLEE